MKQFLTIILSVAFAVTAVAACSSSAAPVSISKLPDAATSEANHTHDQEKAAHISLADAKKDFDAANVVIIDARGAASYNAEHIKGSINIPLADFDAQYKNIPADKKIIVYCSCPNEETSGNFVKKLNAKGISNAFALVGGTTAWKNAGYPMDKK